MNVFYKFLLKFTNLIYPRKIIGRENIPQGRGVFSCNHLSLIDAVYMLDVCSDNVTFLAKKEIFKKKIAKKLIASIVDTIPVDRENPDIKTVISALRVLKNDNKLVVFPEGTRNKTGTTVLQKIKGGTGLFAIKSKSPIIPVMIFKKARLFRKNYVIIGKPFYLDDYYDKNLSATDSEAIDNIIMQKMIDEQNKLFDLIKSKKQKKKLNG